MPVYKRTMMALPGRKNFDDIFSRVDTIGYTNVRDRRTDRRTDTGRQQRDRSYTHSVAQ